MARRVFYSFHYELDYWRTSQVRNIGIVSGNRPCKDNNWEKIRQGGKRAIRAWIDEQLTSRSCTIVLIGAKTAGREFIDYEIERSWKRGLGLVGIHIHKLLDTSRRPSKQGKNPFADWAIDGVPLSKIVRAYNPTKRTSKGAYNFIASNLGSWVEEAIAIRKQF